MTRAQLNGIAMADDIHGEDASRPPALLVMGYGLPGRVWRFIIPELVGERRVITFDNRGAGGTDAPPGPYRMGQMADDSMHLLDHLGIEHAHVIGVSMGGMVSQEIALRHRDRLKSLTLIATHPGGRGTRLPRARGIWNFLAANLAKKRDTRLLALSRLLFPKDFRDQIGEEWLIRVLAEDLSKLPSKEGRRGQLSAIFHHDTRKRLPRLADLPTLIVKPEQDILIRPRGSELLHRSIPNSRILRFTDAGHGLIRQKAPELGAAMRQLFADAEGVA
jgi:3-oxoadipate enol-lactonase